MNVNRDRNWNNSRGMNNNYHGGRNFNSGYGGGRGGQQPYGNGRRNTGFQKFADIEARENKQNWNKNSWNSNNNKNRCGGNQKGFSGTSNIYNNNDQNPEPDPIAENPKTCQNNIRNFEASGSQPLKDTSNPFGSANCQSVRKDLSSTSTGGQKNETTTTLNTDTTKITKIKQVKIKVERKSSSSSSSSSSDTSSSDEDESKKSRESNNEAITKAQSPIHIRLKPLAESKTTTSSNKSSKTDSSTSSSEGEEVEPKPPKQVKKSKKKKTKSEDDVVCLGKVKNKFVLDDDSDGEDIGDSLPKSKVSTKDKKKSSTEKLEQCMLCDKKGHTSFQCQMICKNCSAPYHGFRTCPHPANLGTMMHLFMEFCMQQIQNFQPDQQFQSFALNINKINGTVPQPMVGSPSPSLKTKRKKKSTSKKSGKPSAKKRKFSAKRNDDSDSDTTTSDSSEESSKSEEDSSSEGFQSLRTSKRNAKAKHK
ncbi:protein mushroom body miniature [Stomoxys calcitrans]|uniref:protein mushroom body miniature n=1 Tax=Stomoxys calcitrans TaxID=35570 RepID=UPI0027E2CABC|nr:protein mushroom body miniature [Stomoxys calcitrans]